MKVTFKVKRYDSGKIEVYDIKTDDPEVNAKIEGKRITILGDVDEKKITEEVRRFISRIINIPKVVEEKEMELEI